MKGKTETYSFLIFKEIIKVMQNIMPMEQKVKISMKENSM